MEQTARWHPAFLALRGASIGRQKLPAERRYKLSMSITNAKLLPYIRRFLALEANRKE